MELETVVRTGSTAVAWEHEYEGPNNSSWTGEHIARLLPEIHEVFSLLFNPGKWRATGRSHILAWNMGWSINHTIMPADVTSIGNFALLFGGREGKVAPSPLPLEKLGEHVPTWQLPTGHYWR